MMDSEERLDRLENRVRGLELWKSEMMGSQSMVAYWVRPVVIALVAGAATAFVSNLIS